MIPPIQLGISVGITGLQLQDYKGNGGESGIRTLPSSNRSCYQGDGENPCEHSESNTISFPSYLSSVAPFNYFFAFLELMELMRRRCVHAAVIFVVSPSAVQRTGTMPGNFPHPCNTQSIARIVSRCGSQLVFLIPSTISFLFLNGLLFIDAEYELSQRSHLIARGKNVGRARRVLRGKGTERAYHG
jgi:hypothetical protein